MRYKSNKIFTNSVAHNEYANAKERAYIKTSGIKKREFLFKNRFTGVRVFVWVPCVKSHFICIWAESFWLCATHAHYFYSFSYVCLHMWCGELRTQSVLTWKPTTNSKRYNIFFPFLLSFLSSFFLYVCRQNLNACSRPKPFVRYRTLWRQFTRIIAVMRLCFFLCGCRSLFTYPSSLIGIFYFSKFVFSLISSSFRFTLDLHSSDRICEDFYCERT